MNDMFKGYEHVLNKVKCANAVYAYLYFSKNYGFGMLFHLDIKPLSKQMGITAAALNAGVRALKTKGAIVEVNFKQFMLNELTPDPKASPIVKHDVQKTDLVEKAKLLWAAYLEKNFNTLASQTFTKADGVAMIRLLVKLKTMCAKHVEPTDENILAFLSKLLSSFNIYPNFYKTAKLTQFERNAEDLIYFIQKQFTFNFEHGASMQQQIDKRFS